MSIESKIAYLQKRIAAEIGPRGGKIIGKTRSGKAIYDDVNHADHAKFDRNDHFDAMQAHQNKALEAQNHPFKILHGPEIKHHQENATQHYLKSQQRQSPPRPTGSVIESLENRLAELGARGGKIIGKTKSGKPIYESANHEAHKAFTAGDHKDAMNVHAQHATMLQNHPLKAVHGDLINKHNTERARHSQHLKNLTNPEPAVYDLSKHF